ncbi:2-phosphosulfolactate phosphatase [Candidatus Bathyarchaeota archaeon]|nr:2-phosphosulfolactate phosphatase [Candidatus Bathyarchaeota archaeon]
MEILRLSLVEGANQARGLAVVIDVFRAFTTAAYVMANGADRIIPVGSLEEAFRLRELNPGWLIMGERGGKKVEGFDYGNSPYEVSGVDFTGRTVVQTTSAGTRGIVNAADADERLLGSFVMADAIVAYIMRRNPETVSLVAMGWGGKVRSPEDESLAEYIEKKLCGEEPDFPEMKRLIREDPQGAKFFDPAQPEFVEGDFHCAMDLNRFGFCLRVVEAPQPYVVKG